jgi:hypothetical protein
MAKAINIIERIAYNDNENQRKFNMTNEFHPTYKKGLSLNDFDMNTILIKKIPKDL